MKRAIWRFGQYWMFVSGIGVVWVSWLTLPARARGFV